MKAIVIFTISASLVANLLGYEKARKARQVKLDQLIEAKNKRLDDLNSQFKRALQKLQTEFTKSGDLDMALKVKEMVEEVDKHSSSTKLADKKETTDSSDTKKQGEEEKSDRKKLAFDANGTKWKMYHSKDGVNYRDYGVWDIVDNKVKGSGLGNPRAFAMAKGRRFVMSGWAGGEFSEGYKEFRVKWGKNSFYKGILIEDK